jgi:hypothetical protein
LPQIKSYYEVSPLEYENLKSMHIDIYIDNFLNGENLEKDKLDIYVISNNSNIKIIKNFINQFGNPFDILGLITEKKKNIKQISNEHSNLNLNLKFSEESNSDIITLFLLLLLLILFFLLFFISKYSLISLISSI